MVRMEGAAGNKYKNCSLGMKQRVGIAMALLEHPTLLVLDEPINGLDADGMRLMREALVDITKDGQCSVVVSSHILGELEKVATHYGIVCGGKMIKEMTAEELDAGCRTYTALQTRDMNRTKALLACKSPVRRRMRADISAFMTRSARRRSSRICMTRASWPARSERLRSAWRNIISI